MVGSPGRRLRTALKWKYPVLMLADFNPELKKKVIRSLAESVWEGTVLINRLILVEMRARKHNQIPAKIVE